MRGEERLTSSDLGRKAVRLRSGHCVSDGQKRLNKATDTTKWEVIFVVSLASLSSRVTFILSLHTPDIDSKSITAS